MTRTQPADTITDEQIRELHVECQRHSGGIWQQRAILCEVALNAADALGADKRRRVARERCAELLPLVIPPSQDTNPIEDAIELLDLIATQPTWEFRDGRWVTKYEATKFDLRASPIARRFSGRALDLAGEALAQHTTAAFSSSSATWRAPYLFAARDLIRIRDGAW